MWGGPPREGSRPTSASPPVTLPNVEPWMRPRARINRWKFTSAVAPAPTPITAISAFVVELGDVRAAVSPPTSSSISRTCSTRRVAASSTISGGVRATPGRSLQLS